MARRTLIDCIVDLKAAKELTDDEARALTETYETFERQHRLDLGDEAAAARAAADTVAKADADAKATRSAMSKQAAVLQNIQDHIFNYRDKNGEANVFEAVTSLYTNNARAGRSALETRHIAIDGHFNAILGDFIEMFQRQKITGRYKNAGAQLDNIGREIFNPGSTGDAKAKILADSWRKLTEYIHDRYTAIGGVMHKMSDYLPQWHDPRALRSAGFEKWGDYIFERLDRAKMVDYGTGKALTDDELRGLLRDIFNKVTTEGWYDREPSMVALGAGALWKRRAQQRHLHFKDFDGWKDYGTAFGDGDPLASLIRYKQTMARDIATMELFGPSAEATHQWLKQLVLQQGTQAAAGKPSLVPKAMVGDEGTRNLSQRIAGDAGRMDNEWSILRGHSSVPVSTGWASTFHVLRGMHISSAMGMSFVTALGDIGTAEISRLYAGLHGSQIGEVLKLFTTSLRPAEEMRSIAAAAGMSIDSAARMIHRQAREVKSADVRFYSDAIADRTLGLASLTPWTVAGQHLGQLAFMAEARLAAAESFDALPMRFKEFMERHGINRGDWNIMRQAKAVNEENGHWLRPSDIFAMEGRPLDDAKARYLLQGASDETATRMARRELDAIGEKWAEAITREAEFLVPTSSVRARAAMIGNSRPGTFSGELARSAGQYRMWPVMTMIQWVDRIGAEAAQHGSMSAAKWGTALFVTLSGLGVLSNQLRQPLQGKDFLDMDLNNEGAWKTYAAGILRGGGLGIFGDLIFQDYSRYGASVGATAAGPIPALVDTFAKVIQKGVRQSLAGDDTTFWHDLAQAGYRTLPGNNIWYLNLAGERLLKNQLQRALDPDAERNFRKMEKRLDTATGQEYFWSPGDTLPTRAPGLTTP